MSENCLQLIGTGNSESLRFWNSSALIYSENSKILIDCGFTIKYALAAQQLTLKDIDAVFITHIHGDHVHGLERLGFESRYIYHRRPRLYLEQDLYNLLWDRCLSGSMGNTSCGNTKLEDFFDVNIIKNNAFNESGCCFRTFTTPHTQGKPSYGLILNEKLLFTADTNLIPNTENLLPTGIIIHDCCLYANNPAHATINQLINSYPKKLRQRMLVTHYGDNIDFYRALINREFLGVAQQGQIIEL